MRIVVAPFRRKTLQKIKDKPGKGKSDVQPWRRGADKRSCLWLTGGRQM